MTKPAARRFWQLHLSTVIVLVLFAGLFLSLNVERETIPFNRVLDGLNDFESDFGWPLPVRNYIVIDGVECYSKISSDSKFLYVYKPNGAGAFDSYTITDAKPREHYVIKNLLLNAGFCILLLGIIGTVVEAWARRRQ